jgi:hypothetical protein
MTTTYAADHTDALADVSASGASVTFTLTQQGVYDEATDTTPLPVADVLVTGSAIETKGSLFAYQALNLVAAKARTLFFVPTTYGEVPALDSLVDWGGVTYAVKNVRPIAPNGDAIAATVVVSL